MNNETQNGSPAQGAQKTAPTVEMVKDWVKTDLKTAHYFLGLLLRYPEIVDRAAEEIYEHANRVENGAAIDHVKNAN